jgi:hypothetical protein
MQVGRLRSLMTGILNKKRRIVEMMGNMQKLLAQGKE